MRYADDLLEMLQLTYSNLLLTQFVRQSVQLFRNYFYAMIICLFFTGKLKFTDSRVIFETMKTKEGKHFLCPPEGRRGQQNRDNDFYIVT